LVALGGAVSAQAQAVYSINTVGYVNLDIPAGFSMIANPLDAGDNTLNNVIQSAPDFTTIYKFNPSNGTYDTISSFDQASGQWSNGDAITLAPGEGAFIATLSAFTLTFSGEVMQGELNNPIPAGFSIVSSQVPQGGGITSVLGFNGSDFDTVFQFNNETGTYSIASIDGGTWAPAEPQIGIGESFFMAKLSAGSWDRNFSTDQ
jgi:hypothetical protein